MDYYNEAVALWQSYNIQTVSELESHLEHYRILFAYHSGKIENETITYHDTREIFENGQIVGFTGSVRTLFEQQNQKICYELLKDKIVAKEPLSVSLIKEVHRVLTEGTYDERRYIINNERPGEFKKKDYVTGVHEVGSDAADVATHMSELVEELNNNGKKNPIRAAAYFHAQFEYIHPFADGNGRVGRTLLNYWLMINQYPPLIIYDEDKQQYYSCLQSYDEEEDIQQLELFLKEQTIKTWARELGLSKPQHRRLSLAEEPEL